ncbi:MAG: ABC transporter permease [Chloroflexi bacterium]|nr:ABC transporter permease [Chloroflexota bacterium]
MPLTEGVLLALRGLSANKLRSALTALGIVIGIAAVISLMSIGRGVQESVTAQFQGMGANLLFVRSGSTTSGGVRSASGTSASLTLEDAEALIDQDKAPAVAAVAPERQTFGQAVAGSENMNTRILGVTPEYAQVRNYIVADGEFITAQEDQARSTVAVLGANVAATLFPDSSPVGQNVTINKKRFRVVGILAPKGGSGMGNQDDLIVVPISTLIYRLDAQRTASGGRTVSTINVQAVDEASIDAAVQQIGAILRKRHRITGEDDFSVTTQEDMLASMQQVAGTMTLFLGAIAGISLLVGGIGIMNIMLVSVTERTREIGIRKALGAKRNDILTQFMIEATVLSVVGGGIGVLLGALIGNLIPVFMSQSGSSTLKTVVSADIVLFAFSVSAAIGLFFGIYPSNRAASLNPIEALRYE